MASTCLYACLTTSGHAPNETTDGVLGDLLPDLDQGITELLDSLKCNLAASDGPKHNVPEVFYLFLFLFFSSSLSFSCFLCLSLNLYISLLLSLSHPISFCLPLGPSTFFSPSTAPMCSLSVSLSLFLFLARSLSLSLSLSH